MDVPVTLVIKAPNQKYEDQTINCFLNWTVERLKGHIANVYPSKPSCKDQRLVYSGQLLQDHVRLRDVLRKPDEEYHMMHLVCASHSPPRSPQPHSSAPSDPAAAPAAAPTAGPAAAPTAGPAAAPAAPAGLRYRGPAQHSSSAQGPGGPQGPLPGALPGGPQGPLPGALPGGPQGPLPGALPGGPQGPLPGALSGNMPPHPAYMPMQALWWQQMYARHYYLQYRAAAAVSQNLPAPSSSSPPPQPEPVVQPPLEPQGGPPLNQDQMDLDQQDRDQDQQDRDWLDWLYTASRVGVLLSIVYFYSSFSRFLMVLGAMLLVYLHQVGWHQVGWFPFRPEQPRAEQREAQQQHDMQQMERLMDQGLEQEEPDPPPPEAGFLLTTWAFLSSFFTSLIPDNRPQANN